MVPRMSNEFPEVAGYPQFRPASMVVLISKIPI